MKKKYEENYENSYIPEEIKVGKELNKFVQSAEIEIRFRENRSFDLHIGRIIYRFEGRETKRLPKSILNHPDWTSQISKLFSVREI